MSLATDLQIQKKLKSLEIVTGTQDGQPVWGVVLVPDLKNPIFKRKTNGAHSADIADFGQVIAKGRGEKPTTEELYECVKKLFH